MYQRLVYDQHNMTPCHQLFNSHITVVANQPAVASLPDTQRLSNSPYLQSNNNNDTVIESYVLVQITLYYAGYVACYPFLGPPTS